MEESTEFLVFPLGLINLTKTKKIVNRHMLAEKEWKMRTSAYIDYKYYLNFPKGTKKAYKLIQLNGDIVICV